ncbi:DNA primase [Natronoarchaeum philippinense]|uniref:DNA primase DnaG n=1 Tax=Natronoarchaeum philippinense TaxID=558529 RepID=A0A285NAV2_NATPI|nr:DNA primase DnaG [Natronoarchaeum philippinense]SNZ06559.1 DNA primase [Natronoarchaeum philippinense]
MDDTTKYLIHADVTANGVVERSDVVGAIFGQTEGLLGEELDLRGLQQSSKVGRIDVEIDSSGGESRGDVTIATSLDKVETATLAASLETITRVGPCRATLDVTNIEDVRAAKRRQIVDRAHELLVEAFDETAMSSQEILEEVRQRVRVADVTEYEGLPAGPRVEDSDAVVVVEGRADVLTLLQYGVKNAIAVEGTDVPEVVADLTADRTATAFLDGDRGGDLILQELSQVGDIDYVTFAPDGQSVEDLSRHEVFEALRDKVPYDAVSDASTPRTAVAATDGSATPAPEADDAGVEPDAETESPDAPAAPDAAAGEDDVTVETDDEDETLVDPDATAEVSPADASASSSAESDDEAEAAADNEASDEDTEVAPETLQGHVEAVVGDEQATVRLLDGEFAEVDEAPAGDAVEVLDAASTVPHAIVLDGELSQRIADVAAQRGVAQAVARSLGEFTKRPTSVRLRTAEQLLDADL